MSSGNMWDSAELPKVGLVLEISWPKDRGLFLVVDARVDACFATCAWVWADCMGDAADAMADWNGGTRDEADEELISVRKATDAERSAVEAASREWLAKI